MYNVYIRMYVFKGWWIYMKNNTCKNMHVLDSEIHKVVNSTVNKKNWEINISINFKSLFIQRIQWHSQRGPKVSCLIWVLIYERNSTANKWSKIFWITKILFKSQLDLWASFCICQEKKISASHGWVKKVHKVEYGAVDSVKMVATTT